MSNFFKKVINKSALYYTIIVAVFSIIVLLSNSDKETVFVDPARILYFLPFCVCFAIANTVLQYKTIEAITRWLLHFVLTVLGAFLFIILPANLDSSSGNFMGIILILAIYLVGVLFSVILTSRIRKSLKQDKELIGMSKKSIK